MNISTDHKYDWEKDTWDVIESYFRDKKVLVKHQIESYNDFVDNKIQKIIDEFNPVVSYSNFNQDLGKYMTEYHVEFGDISITKPMINDNESEMKPMYPNDARLRNLTYSTSLTCDVNQRIIRHDAKTSEREVTELPVMKNVSLGKIPIMLQSKYCILSDQTNRTRADMGEGQYDEGGYFIVNGSEKVIVCFERKCENKIFVFPQSKGPSTTYSHIAEITSVDYNSPAYVKPLQIKLTSKEGNFYGRTIRLSITKVRAEIPIFVIFRALGVISDRDIIEAVVYDLDNDISKELIEKLKPSLEEAAPIQSQKVALEYISKYVTMVTYKSNQSVNHKLKYTEDILINEILPHVGRSSIKKVYFLGLMVRKLLFNFMGYIKADDRDSFINKRVESPGTLLASLFRANFHKMVKEFKVAIDKDVKNGRIDEVSNNISKKIKSAKIEQDMKYALATGNWGIKNQPSKKGVAQVMNRLSYLSSLSHRRRIIAPIERNGKQTAPRKLHNTQFGTICCVTGDTEVLLENNEVKHIKDITNNDRVVSFNSETLEMEVTNIQNFFELIPEKLFKLTLEDGRQLKATADHPLLYLNVDKQKYEWKYVGEIKKDDRLLVWNGVETKIVPVLDKIEIEIEPVYDFTTTNSNHSFLVNGIYGSNCVETPEGASIGIVKNLALMTHITLDANPQPVIECLSELGVIPLEQAKPYEIAKYVNIFINGDWVGIHQDPKKFVAELKNRRRKGMINIFTSIAFNIQNKEILINTDGGRLSRPLYIVEDNDVLMNTKVVDGLKKKELSWSNLLAELEGSNSVGAVEYVDTQEEDTAMVAMTYEDLKRNDPKSESFFRYTHCELHPSMMIGVLASNIPFSSHNQCIFEDEPVYMADGTSKKIKDVQVGDEVITFDPETMEQSYTSITHTYTGPTEKKIYDVETYSGRKIKATFDHKFMTNKGWKQLEDIPVVDLENYDEDMPLIGVSLEQLPMEHICKERELIMDRHIFIDKCIEAGIESPRKYAMELVYIGLLPLYNDHPKLGIISRLYGFSLADAWIGIGNKKNPRISVDFGHIESFRQYNRDFEYIGFEDSGYRYDSRTKGYGNTHKFEKSGAYPAFLVALGRFVGNRTTQATPEVPEWIMNGSKLVKREFIAGFQGGDGCRVRGIRRKNLQMIYSIAKTNKWIEPKFQKEMELFMSQCVELLRVFDIEVKMLELIKESDEKINRVNIGYKISDKQENLIKYFEKVGYRYDYHKIIESGKTIEYLKYYSSIKGNKKNFVAKNHQKIENWSGIVKVSDLGASLFVPLLNKTESKNVKIADITTKSENMSFFSGNAYLTHNSPRRWEFMQLTLIKEWIRLVMFYIIHRNH